MDIDRSAAYDSDVRSLSGDFPCQPLARRRPPLPNKNEKHWRDRLPERYRNTPRRTVINQDGAVLREAEKRLEDEWKKNNKTYLMKTIETFTTELARKGIIPKAVPYKTLYRAKRGEPVYFESIVGLAYFFDIDIEYFFSDNKSTSPAQLMTSRELFDILGRWLKIHLLVAGAVAAGYIAFKETVSFSERWQTVPYGLFLQIVGAGAALSAGVALSQARAVYWAAWTLPFLGCSVGTVSGFLCFVYLSFTDSQAIAYFGLALTKLEALLFVVQTTLWHRCAYAIADELSVPTEGRFVQAVKVGWSWSLGGLAATVVALAITLRGVWP